MKKNQLKLRESKMPVTKTTKTKTKVTKLYYFRIYDDQERLNYMKSSLTHKQVQRHMKSYEKLHQKYFNPEFIDYLRKYDKEAELIEVSDISY